MIGLSGTSRNPQIKLSSRLEYQKQVEAGNLPDFLSALEDLTGRRLNDKELDDIQVFSYEDKSDLSLHVGMRFLYKGAYRVSMNFVTDQLNPHDLVKVHNVGVTSVLTGLRTLYEKNHLHLIRDSDFMGDGPVASYPKYNSDDSEKKPIARGGLKRGYHNPTPTRANRFATTTHNVSYNKTSGYIECSCLVHPARWCPVIKEQIEKGVDIQTVDTVIQHLRYNSNLMSVEVNVPVMPRTIMRLKATKHQVDDPSEPGTYTEEIRFEYGDYISVWWEPMMGLRGILTEVFAILNSSGAIRQWTEKVHQAKYCLENPSTRRIRFLCNNRWHDWKKDELLYAMVGERMNDGSSPIEQTRNMAYLATLFAFYDMFENRCYSCFVGFQPEQDVPDI